MEAKKIYEVVFDTKDDRAHIEFASSRTAAEMLAEHENKLHLITQGVCRNYMRHGKFMVVEHTVHTVATAKKAISKDVIPELACYKVDIYPANMCPKDTIHVAKLTSINTDEYLKNKNITTESDDGSATTYVSIMISGNTFENLGNYDKCVRELHCKLKKIIEGPFGDKYRIIHFI